MPKALHKKLKKSARKAGLKSGTKRHKAYVHGTMNKIEKRKKAKRNRTARRRGKK